MGATSNYAWPYPANSDGPFGPSQIQALATAADTTVKAIDVRVAALETAMVSYSVTWTATSGSPTVGTGGSAAKVGYYRQSGKDVDAEIGIVFGTSGISSGTGAWNFSLPVTARVKASINNPIVGRWTVVDTSTGDRYEGDIHNPNSTTVQCAYGTAPVSASLAVNVPMAYAAGDTVTLKFRYEAA